ncbi:hypothetical protein [Streptomyces iconiensis]|uniref:Uncharacterized protein n=1 Tax=Streptomyces iconiensis TaxID=1384038 RepID=A0ABT6ZRY9_9ACTN|nr:hypothetical protein [Streptomyces iconiensis]MDJ1131820.1 hypothetical protein [Streptomyces iconiensis]
MPTDSIQASDDAVSELRAALADVGVILPSLGVDPVGVAAEGGEPPLIVLGRCTAGTAWALVAALKGAAG